MENLVEFREIKLIQSVVMKSTDPAFEFEVVATWYYDFTSKYYEMKDNQTSHTYWKDGFVQKVNFMSPSEIVA